MQRYRILHAVHPLAMVHPTPHGPFEDVAELGAVSLEDAFRRSQHGVLLEGETGEDGPGWHERAGVRRTAHDTPRSTSVGDLIVTPDGQAYLVEPTSLSAVGEVEACETGDRLHLSAGEATVSLHGQG